MRKIKFELFTKKISHGMMAIFVNCVQLSKSLLLDTDIRIFPDEWDEHQARIISNPNAKQLNRILRNTIYTLEGYEMDYDGEFTLDKLKELWQGNYTDHDFYAMMEKQIEHRDIKKGTRDIHKRVLAHLKRYKPQCNVSELTEDFITGFARYMKDSGLCANTISMHIRTFRCYYHIAQKLFGNKVPSGSFDFYHEKQADRLTYKMKSLTDEDIRILENYIVKDDTPQNRKEIIERFLFMAYTGTRISDFVSLGKSNFVRENGIMWLSYTSIKTETPVKIPLSIIFDGRGEQIIMRHINNLNSFFYINRKGSFNTSLNTTARYAGLNKHITAHVARHTCASRLVNKDVPITTIQKIIGHRSLKMTMVYASINENTLIRQLGK